MAHVAPVAPVAPPPTPPKTPEPLRFHHYGAGDEGVTDLGIDISVIPISTAPAPSMSPQSSSRGNFANTHHRETNRSN